MPITIFYPPQELRGPTLYRLESEGKLVCAQCPVIEQCLRFALDIGEPYGTWGGLTARERLQLARDEETTYPQLAEYSTDSKAT